MQIESDTLVAGAVGYRIGVTLYDMGTFVVLFSIISTIRLFVGRKHRNPNPSGWWYVPKIIGMLLALLFAVQFVREGSIVVGFDPGYRLFQILTFAAAIGALSWAYIVVWKPLHASPNAKGKST